MKSFDRKVEGTCRRSSYLALRLTVASLRGIKREQSAASHFGGFELSIERETRGPLVLGRHMHRFASLEGGLESQNQHRSLAQTWELF